MKIFTHLFCVLTRLKNVPTRYVSAYLNQSSGLFGDSQIHAWAETYISEVRWKGLDAVNNFLGNTNHIKIYHDKDYNDWSPLRGIIYSESENKTTHATTVESQQ